MSSKDLFSRHSGDYAKYRPTYPPSLFTYLADLVPHHDCAWDCATGNGQAALLLAPHFQKVIATDLSDKQLKNATPHPRIEYRLGTAEHSGLANDSVDLITVAQAFHWLKAEDFAQEAQRVGKKGAVLAIWCYELAQITPAIDAVVLKLYREILGPYWHKERQLVDEGYRHVHLPFTLLETPPFSMTAEWSLEHLAGYLQTWSALQDYREKTGKNPLDLVRDPLIAAWGETPKHLVKWDLGLRVWRM